MEDQGSALVVAHSTTIPLMVRRTYGFHRHPNSMCLTANNVGMDHASSVMTLRRWAGLVAFASLSLLSVTGVPLVCSAHDATQASPVVPHAAMSMAADQINSAAGECDQCLTQSDELPPCDHQGASGDCASMVSCASGPAETQSAPLVGATMSVRVLDAAGAAHASATRSPETPPPRV